MQKINKNINVLIVGGGLSGLHTAYELNKLGIQFHLLEARDRLGGRILSKIPGAVDQGQTNAAFDLGPSWFWPHQSRIALLLKELDLSHRVFEQSEIGSSLYEDQSGDIHQGITGASMRGSYRIHGGIQGIITELTRQIPANTCLTDSPVNAVSYDGEILTTRFEANAISSDFVVLALPPRLAAGSIDFYPQLSSSRLLQLKSIATWMAGHAKVAVHYSKPFWHDQGFSGDVISQQGPLNEIHDASSPCGKPYGLIGFVSLAPKDRLNNTAGLRSAIITQLVRLFGKAAAKPLDVYIKDWAFDPYTSTIDDQQQMLFHPSSNMEATVESSWNSRLIWSGSETAGMGERNNGYLEGALEASERTIKTIMSRLDIPAR